LGDPLSVIDPKAALAIEVQNVTHTYQKLVAINDLSLGISNGQIFGILGPNGSGKSTLFRLVSTLVGVQRGSIHVFGFCTKTQQSAVRKHIGVVFQSPSLDRKLTVLENLNCQASLYGLVGIERVQRIDELGRSMGLQDKMQIRCEKLSGGQKRRVELAKGLLHRPRLLLLDEPSTGLDPAARLDLWHALAQLKNEHGTTIVLTTHLLEEADKCDRIAILNQGALVAFDTPENLRTQTGGMVVQVASNEPQSVVDILSRRLNMNSTILEQQVRITSLDAISRLPAIIEETKQVATSVSVGRPSLEDVFIARTGHKFHSL
jgi:ABC-2 type transport system ATP-binding protein